MPSRRVWQCKGRHAKCQFSVKVGTIMEDSAIALDKWLTAMWMLANCKNGVSSWEIHRAIGVTQKNAWHMLHRIRFAQQAKQGGKLFGQIEADETLIGGKFRNMHKDIKARRITGTGGKDKTAVMGIVERGGKVVAKVVDNTKKKTLQSEIRDHFTDSLKSYEGLTEFQHEVVDHAVEYVPRPSRTHERA